MLGRIVILGTSNIPSLQRLDIGIGHHFRYHHKELGSVPRWCRWPFAIGNQHLRYGASNHSSWEVKLGHFFQGEVTQCSSLLPSTPLTITKGFKPRVHRRAEQLGCGCLGCPNPPCDRSTVSHLPDQQEHYLAASLGVICPICQSTIGEFERQPRSF